MEPEIIEKNNECYVAWKEGYKLHKIAEENGVINDLPCEASYVSFQELVKSDNNLIFSDPKSGRKNFVESYTKHLDQHSICWLVIKGELWDKIAFKTSGIEKNKPSEDFFKAIVAFKEAKGIGLKLNILKDALVAEKKGKIVLIIQDISKLEDGVKEIVMAFRQAYENGITANCFSILMVDTVNKVFMDAAEESGYAALCVQYRMPHLDKQEIKLLLEKKSFKFDEEALDKFIELTGGQVLLVKDFSRRLINNDSTMITTTDINRAAREMRSNPPLVTKVWQQGLKKILEENPQLIFSLGAYVEGHTLSELRFPPPIQELDLFISGWLKLNSSGRWGISSDLHVHLAQPVLSDLKGELE